MIIRTISLLAALMMAGCSGGTPEPQKVEQKGESAGQVIDKYTNTLTSAPDKARKAADATSTKVNEGNSMAQQGE